MSTAFEGARKSIHDRPPFLTIILYVITKYTAKFFFFLYFRVYVKNAKALPKKGRVIIAPIHRSNLDAPLVGGLCRRKVHYIAKGSLFEKRFAAWALPGMGAIPLDRTSTADKRVLDASMNSLLSEQALVVFPERQDRKCSPCSMVHPGWRQEHKLLFSLLELEVHNELCPKGKSFQSHAES
jgi:1-acyl-sn-glycerol-3-phosphate acyltransferase